MIDLHPLVRQLRFTRSEFKRGLKGLSEEDGAQIFRSLSRVEVDNQVSESSVPCCSESYTITGTITVKTWQSARCLGIPACPNLSEISTKKRLIRQNGDSLYDMPDQ